MTKKVAHVMAGIITLSLLCCGVWAEETKPAQPAKPEVQAQSDQPSAGQSKQAPKPAAKKPPFPPISDVLKDGTKMEGFISLYKKDEKLYAEIPNSTLEKPFMMSVSVAGGVAQGYLVSGMTRDESIYYWKLADSRVFLVKKNVRHIAKTGDPIHKAVAEDFSDSVIAALPLRAKSDRAVVVNLGDFLFTDYGMIGKDLRSVFGSDYNLDSKRTTWGSIKTFPDNVEIEVAATYSGKTWKDLRTVADSRAVSITLHYSFSAIPKSDYKPRQADDRIGFFLTVRKDYSLKGSEAPFSRFVNRWKLEKADPSADISPPRKPIVFYIEKSVPYEYRPIVREGVLEWNKAFEKAGFINAIEVRYQEEGAGWDAEDVRYNTIRWMTGEARYAIGPSRTNPLTGEIYDADILVDSNWLRTFEVQYKAFVEQPESSGARLGESGPANAETLDAFIKQLESGASAVRPVEDGRDLYRCEYALGLREQMGIGALAAAVRGEVPEKKGLPQEFIRQGLKELIMHEVGHTLGLRHNFKASSTIPFEDLHNKELSSKNGLTGSVMDYSLVNVAPKDEEQGHYFTPTLGAWDYLAIEYGYKQLQAKSADDKKKALQQIAERAAQPKYAYGTDEDISSDVDPLVNQRDMSDDPLAFSMQRVEIVTGLWDGLLDKLTEPGEGYQKARTAFFYTLRDMQRSLYHSSRYVGGFYVNRNHRGDEGERPVLEIVPAAKQREALDFVCANALSDAAFDFDPEMLTRLAPNRWNHWGSGMPSRLDLGIHETVLAGQLRIINRLFSSKVLSRIEGAGLYVKADEDVITVADVYQRVTETTWSELDKDLAAETWSASNPFISGYRRNLQRAFLKYVLLNHLLNPPSSLPQDARSVAWAAVAELGEDLEALLQKADQNAVALDPLSDAHLRESQIRIKKALEAAFSVQNY